MLVDRAVVQRLERAETATVDGLVDALVAIGATGPVPTAVPLHDGLLVVAGSRRYVNRVVGSTLGELTDEDVAVVARHYGAAGVPAAVQLSSWAPRSTVHALASAGFGPAWCRSVLAVDPRSTRPADHLPPSGLDVVEVGDDAGLAAAAAEVMAADLGTGADRSTSDEFMAADRAGEGTVQLLATIDGVAVGCGSLTVVRDLTGTVGWLGAAATVPAARRRGV